MRRLIPLLLFLGCAACAEDVSAPLSPTLGEAYASMDAQIIPAPVVEGPPTSSAARAVRGIDRYEHGQQPLQVAPTSEGFSLQSVGADQAGPPTGAPAQGGEAK